MRKTFVAALVALLVMLAFASCDNNPTGQNGDGFVTLGIDVGGTTGNSRSLLDGPAHDEGKYLEVIFKQGSDYVRAETAWDLRGKLKIRILTGDYGVAATGAPNDALLLIGRLKDGTLLAIGTLKDIDNDPDTPLTVTQSTNSIAFTVKSLIADIHAQTAVTDFAINESSPSASTIISTAGWTTVGTTRNGTYTLDNVSPCFQVPINKVGIEATLNIQNLTGSNIPLLLASTPADAVEFEPLSGAAAIDATLTNTAGDNLGLAANKIGFKFNSGASTAGYIVTFKVPVVGFAVYNSATPAVNAGLKYALTWYIRGGTKEGLPDLTGITPNEGVALIVTQTPRTYADISGITTEW
jgi:hypothetical protein